MNTKRFYLFLAVITMLSLLAITPQPIQAETQNQSPTLSPTDIFVTLSPDPILFRMDKNGNVLWEKRLPFEWWGIYEHHADRNLTEDAFYINVSFTGRNLVDGKGVIQKYDAYGNLVWSIPVLTGDAFYGQISANPVGGGIYLADSNVGIFKIDTNGNILWGPKTFGCSTGSWRVAADVRSGGVYADNWGCDVVLKVDANGNEVWRSENIPPSSINANPVDGGVYVGADGGNRITYRFDADGNIQWVKYDFPGPYTYPRTVSSVDGSITVMGFGPTSYLLAKAAMDGTVLWTVPNSSGPWTYGDTSLAADIEENYIYTGDTHLNMGISKYSGTDGTTLIWHSNPANVTPYTSEYGPEYHVWTGVPAQTTHNQPPVANAGGPYSVTWGATVTLDGSGSTDSEGNITLYEWDLNADGTYDVTGVTTTTSFDQVGDHPVTLRVTDTGGLSDTDTAMITVIEPTPPECPEGFYETAGDVWAINPAYVGNVKVLPNNGSGWWDKPAIGNGDYVSISVNNNTGDVWAMNYHDGWVRMLPFNGSSWQVKPAIGAHTQGIYNISVNSSTGDVWTMEYNGRVLMLPNGGTSWQEMPSPGYEWYAWYALSVNSNTGEVWAIHRINGRAFMLPNGGTSWQEKPSAPAGSDTMSGSWWGLYVNSNTGDVWALRGDGKVMMLPNGGNGSESWQDKPALDIYPLFQISVNSNTGDVWVVNYNGIAKMLPNGGTSWQDKPALGSTGWHGFFVVAPSCKPEDRIEPVTEAVLTGTQGNNGWYISDVLVTLSALDNEGGVGVLKTEYSLDSGTNWQEYTQPFTVTEEGMTTVLYRSIDKAKNQEQDKTLEIKIDKTAPIITASINPALPASGWWNIASGVPTVSFFCSDATSGLAGTCPAVYTFTEGVNQSYSQTIYDNAGNNASDGVSNIDVDLIAPTIAWNSLINDSDNFYFGYVPTAPTCTASDGLSGLDGSCVVSGYSVTVGSHTLIATAKDNAGNQSTETRSYSVLGWTLRGFYQPVDMNGVVNVAKNGSTVPLKFEVFAGSTELTDVTYIKSLTYGSTTCDIGAVTDEIELTATGGTSLRYADGQFIYNWKTPNTAGKCYRVTMTTIDGSSLVAYFKLK